MAIAIYARVSTEEQAKNGYSLSEQIRECRRKTSQADTVIEYVDEGISGEFLDRPALSQLRKDVQNGRIHKVICLDPDRLSRKLMNQLILSEEIEKRAQLTFVNGEYQRTPEGMLFYQMRGAIAEFEKAKITERMSRGRREKARQGKVLRDFQIYGYDYDRENEQLIVNDYEARVVHIIFHLFIHPSEKVKGINGIAKYLTAQGIPTKRKAKQWHRQVVRQILMNRAYIGEFYQNRWNTEGMLGNSFRSEEDKVRMSERPKDQWIKIPCPAIISREQFFYAQKILEESRRRWSGQSKQTYLLSGLLRCADCNNTLTGRRQKNWGRYELVYSDQKNTAGAKHRGCGNTLSCEYLDELIWSTIKEWLCNPKEIAAALDVLENTNPVEWNELERVKKDLEKARNGKQRILDLLIEDDEMSTDEIKERFKLLTIKEERLVRRSQELEAKLSEMSNSGEESLLKNAFQFYLSTGNSELLLEAKKEIIRHVVREIRVGKNGEVNILTF